MAGPLSMVLVGQRGAEEGHHPIAGELVDGALVSVDLIHQDLEAAVQDLVDLFRVQFLGEGGIVGHVGEKDGDELALPFQGGAGGEDLVDQVLGGVGVGWGEVYGTSLFPIPQLVSTLIAKLTAGWIHISTLGAGQLQFASALAAELRPFGILKLAGWALHFLLQSVEVSVFPSE